MNSRYQVMVELYEGFLLYARNWSNEWNMSNQIGLSPSHILILELLENQSLRPSSLAACLHITTGGITGLTNKLVKDGLVDRKPLIEDRRAIGLYITSAGKAMLKKAREQKYQQMQKMFGVLTDSELIQLKQMILKLNRAD
ncbi:MarR family winged helix-turn-helix transcriptional regulator [Halalkalibacter akibai]|uniref:RNA polymerase sigma factor n=1 Tax=Halalkalibacter akibai (strain ATCC 43226 / DSM 21942 / CIP 109018 / JCM 9157 / 1139) TaxID=1236973 RepID=W4QRW1_HALA3|nr:MarR family transcriptional regulator [Halalkalibacter akibai]GAE34836.1 RNA polymerase sigma factor [Halalkalibacter akibai JCM 9157]